MKTLLASIIVASATLLAGCVAVPTRHGVVVAPAVPVVGVGVGYGYHYGYGYGPGPYYR
jgi:hypothetical protein